MSGVLVTGASRGIGRAVAEAFARDGHRVAVHYGHNPPVDSGHLLVQGLSDPDAVARVAEEADEGLGGIDVLVNNAAVAPTPATAHAVPAVSYADWQAIWRRTLDVNLLGAANLSYCVARKMIERGRPGRIVNIGSRGAFRGEPEHPAYGASKAALHALGQSLAVALAPYGIAVTSVAPGMIATERQAGRIDDAVRAESPFGRVGTPEEVAAAVRYLAAADATWASGTVLDLNGASYLRM